MNDRLKALNVVNEREVNEYSLIHELYSRTTKRTDEPAQKSISLGNLKFTD